MFRILFYCAVCILITACQSSNSNDQIVSQVFVHKYGFETSSQDWEARDQDGQVVSMLKNGIKVSRSYENGQLHGLTTYTFPHSTIVEKTQLYGGGTLLKEQLNDAAGMPIREEIYEFDQRILITLWDDKGVPLSIEEYDDEVLMEGKYYTPEHELEAAVAAGSGERIKRERTGLLISRDEIKNGMMAARTTYHPNGAVHTVSHYENYQVCGPQIKYTASGKPLMELNWKNGVLEGQKIVYRNGQKVAVIPYVKGKKHGIEYHYDDLGALTAEIEWRGNKKHGATNLYSEEITDTEWFFKGQSVSADKFKTLDSREQIVSEFRESAAQ